LLLSEEVVKGANGGTEVIGEAEEQWLEEEQDEEEEEQEGVEVEGSGGGGGATAGRGAPIIDSTNFCLYSTLLHLRFSCKEDKRF
jgi:hypothetical protein